MNKPVNLSEIIDAMDSQSNETRGYLNKETGEVVLLSALWGHITWHYGDTSLNLQELLESIGSVGTIKLCVPIISPHN